MGYTESDNLSYLQQKLRSSKFSSYLVDLLILTAVLVFARYNLLEPKHLYVPFFTNESSEAFMQITYYLEALRTGASPFWDQYINLATQGAPQSPIFSPITLLLVSTALLFNITDIEQLAYMFAIASYAVQVLTGFSMYVFLRFLSLGRTAAIIGAVGYTYNWFVGAFGIYHGYYRISALMLVPLVFICFIKLFSQKGDVFRHLALSGFLLGMCFVCNGDVKPTMYFVPVLLLTAYFEGYRTHGLLKTTYLLVAIIVIAGLICSVQLYPTSEVLKEGVKSTWNQYLPRVPLRPDNTLLGFSQNPFSLVMGLLSPDSYYEYYNNNVNLGISHSQLENRFSFGIPLLILSIIGVFYNTKRHIVWFLSFVGFLLYILGSSTPLWPIFGFLSEHAHVRYPTRAAILLYFLFSIYAAYGVEVITRQADSEFYTRWFNPFVKYLLVFIGIVSAGLVFIAFQYRFNTFSPLGPSSDSLSLYLSGLLVSLLIVALTCWLLKSYGITPPDYLLKSGPVLILLFTATLFLFLSSGFLSYYRSSYHLTIDAGGIRLHRELLIALTALVMTLVAVVITHSTRHNPQVLLTPFFAGMVILFLRSDTENLTLPPVTEPSAVFKRDVELEPLYQDKDLPYYRIYIPPNMKQKLSPEIGITKCIHNYCCRQYMDKLRLAFGLEAGPIAMEGIGYIRDKYGHPFWRLYNVKYIVDEFEDTPSLLPNDSNSYERVSEKIIKIKDTKPLVFFMSNFKFLSPAFFHSQVIVEDDPSILEKVYLHDPLLTSISPTEEERPYQIKIEDMRSGKLRVYISTEVDGFLVFSEVWAPSWRAYVDGVEAKVLRAYGILQAVELKAGTHEVFFEYNIFHSLRMRAAVAAALLASLFVLVAMERHLYEIANIAIASHSKTILYVSLFALGVALLTAVWGNLESVLNRQVTSKGVLGYNPGRLKMIKLPKEGLRVSSVNDLNATRHQRYLTSWRTGLRVSSANDLNAGGNNLIDGDPLTFWHAKNPRLELVEWVVLDLGVEKEVKMLRILPRRGYLKQMWKGNNAVWEGSNDGQTWQTITTLQMKKLKLRNDSWVSFVLPKAHAFRYYRLKIADPFFLSLAELEVFN